MLSSTPPMACPHCNAVPTSVQAQFCDKCGNSLIALPLPTTVLPAPTSQALPSLPPPTVKKWVAPPRHTPQITSLAPQGAVTQRPASKGPAAPAPAPGSPLAVITPAFPAPITPRFDDRPRRIFFACLASPIIGVGLGAEPVGLLSLWLINAGLPEVLLPISMAVGFIGMTALIAYIIMADKLALIGALIARRKIESVEPINDTRPQHGELARRGEVKGSAQSENSHQWAKQENWQKTEH